MSYQVLARKYRSQNFDQMIGQNHISQTITNALKNNRLPHALLFTGIRGTGKTSSARILAKSLRCQNAVDYKPCDTCTNCSEIVSGKSIDVIEIDGASNNGVDAIRDLRDNVMFSPSSGLYKIFIIDEVHMLSNSAFNALLKTLEEPPKHVIFILATTEVQKIPQTILSRCQRFDFRKVSLNDLTKHLQFICNSENIKIDSKGIWLIAQQGQGSVRDCLSLLDQIINFAQSEESISENSVTEILGLTERSLIFSTFQNIINRKDDKILEVVHKLNTISLNTTSFLEDLLKLFRHAILIKSASQASLNNDSIDLPADEIDILHKIIFSTDLNDLHMLFDMCFKSLQEATRAYDPLLVLEVSLLRMSQAPYIKDLKKILLMQTTEVKADPKPFESSAQQAMTLTEIPKITPPKTQPILMGSAETWAHFITFLKKNEPILSAKFENLVFQKFDSIQKTIYLEIPAIFSFLSDQIIQNDNQQKLNTAIDSFFGTRYTLIIQKSKISASESPLSKTLQKEVLAEEKLKLDWSEDPRIKKAQEIFKGTLKITKSSS